MKLNPALVLATTLVISGCATHPDKMQASYVSPIQYQKYDCDQIADETARVERKITTLHGQLADTADTDSTQMGVGLILLWPTLFFLDGDGPQATEYSRLKGEYEALEQVSIEKKCALTFKEIKSVKAEPVKETAPGKKYEDVK